MSVINRRGFLGDITRQQIDRDTAPDTITSRYTNKTLPTGLRKITGTLADYTASWTDDDIIHLLRRTTYGVKYSDIKALRPMDAPQAVKYLLDNQPAPPAPPVVDYNDDEYKDPTGLQTGQTWVNSPYTDASLNWARIFSLKGWWMKQLCSHNLSLTEKMAFFWHNHFSNEMGVVFDARMTYRQHTLFLQHAMGNFKTLVKEITKDPSMLRYLNGYVNEASAPDENYGRELQELFTLGKTNNPNYTEADVKAAARVLTGWRVDATTTTAFFDPQYHDTSNKQFSAFYNNRIINGKTGADGASETDELIDMIFAKAETARYICRRLYRYFVYYVIDDAVEQDIIAPLAQTLIDNGYEIKPVLQQLLASNHFFDPLSRGCHIKNPLDVVVGMYRCYDMQIPDALSLNDQSYYRVWLRRWAADMGLDVGDPPNVSGYPAYYQVPEYYQMWINATTLPKRMEYSDMMLSDGIRRRKGYLLHIDTLAFANTLPDADDPNKLVDIVTFLLLGLPVSAATKERFKSILLSGQADDMYWKTAWDAYLINPTDQNKLVVESRLIAFLTEVMRLPEFQLC